ncbi:cytochrome P450 78A5-like [Senna tora]|uniref:Cytochrome P450 78A5-like n=1 Tax=Senna tora TaxID=362788 RepID=A0A835CH02_9FABA|nr:cytochrome P450 78A5-like [Senna tora]
MARSRRPRLGSLQVPPPSSPQDHRHSRTFRFTSPRPRLRLHRVESEFVFFDSDSQSPLRARGELQGEAADGILGGPHAVRHLEPSGDGEGDPQQLGLRGPAGQGVGVRAPVPPRNGIRAVRRVLEEPEEDLGDARVLPEATRVPGRVPRGDRAPNGGPDSRPDGAERRGGGEEGVALRIAEQRDDEHVREELQIRRRRRRGVRGGGVGVRKRCRNLVGRVNSFVGKIIEEHRIKKVQINEEEDEGVGSGGDFVDVLLDLEKENKMNDSDMVAVLWEMIFRGTDTVAILLEWIIARMVLHPDLQSKAQSEIDSVVGYNRWVSDVDLPKLPYVRAIVKETLRMHPPGPLLSWARLAIHDTHVAHHFIPAGTTAMVNMWAITHDPQVWSEPSEFKPERFMRDGGDDVVIMGSDLRLAPFGSGRRVCPGKAMGLATVELWLAILLQKFKWVPSGSGSVDLSECLKLSLEMKHSLVSKAIPRDAS